MVRQYGKILLLASLVFITIACSKYLTTESEDFRWNRSNLTSAASRDQRCVARSATNGTLRAWRHPNSIMTHLFWQEESYEATVAQSYRLPPVYRRD